MFNAKAVPSLSSHLTVHQRKLVDTMSAIGFGRIESLVVRSGEPLLEAPTTRVIRKLKIGSEADKYASGAPFQLKEPVVQLLRTIHELGNGFICCIEVKHGLPFTVEVEQTPDAQRGIHG